MDARNLLIRASAGTGKTFQLSNRYLSLLLCGERPESILATTFTRKAAGEILERILKRLAVAATSDDDAAKLCNELGQPIRPAAEFANLLHDLVAELYQLRVSTLDAFFAKLGQTYALELQLPAGWRILEASEETTLKLRAVDRLLASLGPEAAIGLLSMLDKGESKRRVTQNIFDTVDSFLDVHRDARPDAWRCVPHQSPVSASDIDRAAETLIALCPVAKPLHGSLPRDIAGLVGHVVSENWEKVFGSALVSGAIDGSYRSRKVDLPDEFHAPLDTLASAATAAITNQLADRSIATGELLDTYVSLFDREKLDRRGLEFGDVARRLKGSGENVTRDYRLDADIRHVMLDEFQDTSLTQWAVLRPLSQRAAEHPDGSVFCVGDVKQAIYGWRGGVAAIFDAFRDEVADVVEQPLNDSWRSSPIISQTVNDIFGAVDRIQDRAFVGRSGLQTWRERFQTHGTNRDDLEGYAAVQVIPAGDDDDPTFRPDWIARFVAEEHARRPAATIGVLVRTGAELVKLASYLRALDLDVSEEGGQPIGDSGAVLAVRSLLRLIDHPGDTEARFHVVHTFPASVTGISSHRDDDATFALSHSLRDALTRESLGSVVRRWCEPLVSVCGPRDLMRLRQLISLAESFEGVADPTIDAFLQVLEEAKLGDSRESPIRVMTVHKSKGLEFDIVVLPQLDQPLAKPKDAGYAAAAPKPTQPPDRVVRYVGKESQAALPDEIAAIFESAAAEQVVEGLCLFYVAVTRAKQALHMLVPADPLSKDGKPRVAGSSDAMPKASDLIRATLCGGGVLEAGEPPWTAGDANWTLYADDETAAVSEPAFVRIELKSPGPVERNVPRRSPSQFERHEVDHYESSEDELLPQHLSRPPAGMASQRGTLLHRWMQEVTWTGEPVPTDDRLRELANFLDGPPQLADSAIADFHTALSLLSVQQVLTKPECDDEATIQLLREQSFAVPHADVDHAVAILTGSIDRLVVYECEGVRRAAVFDWKTDRLMSESAIASRTTTYVPQMAAYREAVHRIFGIDCDQIDVSLVFLGPDRLVPIDGNAMDSAWVTIQQPAAAEVIPAVSF